MIQNVNFVGAGELGGRLARRLIDAGCRVTICDRNPKILASFQGSAAHVTHAIAECPPADPFVFVVLDASQIDELVFGASGLDEKIDSGSPPLFLVLSTVLPQEMTRLAERVAAKGIRVVDAPVTGGLTAAEQGRMLALVGGEDTAVAEALPLLHIMAGEIVRCGDLGTGQAAKIIHNMVGVTNTFLMAEAIALMDAIGLPVDTCLRIMDRSSARNSYTHDLSATADKLAALTRDPSYFGTMCDIGAKDTGMAARLGEEAGLEVPLARQVSSALRTMERSGALALWLRAAQTAQESARDNPT